MKYEFDAATTSHAVSLAANSIMHSTCANLVIEKVVCGENFPFDFIAGKQMKDLPAGDYVIKEPALCKDCWICIEEKIGDGVVAVSSVVVGEVEITNWDELPLGIEAALTTTDCIADAAGETIGRVGWCKVVDEESGDTSWKKLALIRGVAEPVDFDPAIHTEVDCIEKEDCTDAAIVNINGDDVNPAIGALADSISIQNPTCCTVLVKTSIGDIEVDGEQGYSDTFKCPLTIDAITITGDCDKSLISMIFKNG